MSAAPPKAEQDSSLKIYFRLLGYVKPYVGIFLLSILGFVIFASTQPMLAGILKYFVDGLIDPLRLAEQGVFLRDLDWVEEEVAGDYGLRKLSNYLRDPGLSLGQALAIYREVFLGV